MQVDTTLDSADVARVLTSVAKAYSGLGAPDQALPYCLAALDMYTRLHGTEDHVEVATALYNVGRLHSARRTFPTAHRYHAASLAMQRRLCAASGGADEALVRCVVEGARVQVAMGWWIQGAALAWEAHALARVVGVFGPQRQENAQRLRWCRRVVHYLSSVVTAADGS